MTSLEATTWLRTALVQVQVVKSGIDRYEMPGRDAWWVLNRVEADLSDAIARFEPVAEEADPRPLMSGYDRAAAYIGNVVLP